MCHAWQQDTSGRQGSASYCVMWVLPSTKSLFKSSGGFPAVSHFQQQQVKSTQRTVLSHRHIYEKYTTHKELREQMWFNKKTEWQTERERWIRMTHRSFAGGSARRRPLHNRFPRRKLILLQERHTWYYLRVRQLRGKLSQTGLDAATLVIEKRD